MGTGLTTGGGAVSSVDVIQVNFPTSPRFCDISFVNMSGSFLALIEVILFVKKKGAIGDVFDVYII